MCDSKNDSNAPLRYSATPVFPVFPIHYRFWYINRIYVFIQQCIRQTSLRYGDGERNRRGMMLEVFSSGRRTRCHVACRRTSLKICMIERGELMLWIDEEWREMAMVAKGRTVADQNIETQLRCVWGNTGVMQHFTNVYFWISPYPNPINNQNALCAFAFVHVIIVSHRSAVRLLHPSVKTVCPLNIRCRAAFFRIVHKRGVMSHLITPAPTEAPLFSSYCARRFCCSHRDLTHSRKYIWIWKLSRRLQPHRTGRTFKKR